MAIDGIGRPAAHVVKVNLTGPMFEAMKRVSGASASQGIERCIEHCMATDFVPKPFNRNIIGVHKLEMEPISQYMVNVGKPTLLVYKDFGQGSQARGLRRFADLIRAWSLWVRPDWPAEGSPVDRGKSNVMLPCRHADCFRLFGRQQLTAGVRRGAWYIETYGLQGKLDEELFPAGWDESAELVPTAPPPTVAPETFFDDADV